MQISEQTFFKKQKKQVNFKIQIQNELKSLLLADLQKIKKF